MFVNLIMTQDIHMSEEEKLESLNLKNDELERLAKAQETIVENQQKTIEELKKEISLLTDKISNLKDMLSFSNFNNDLLKNQNQELKEKLNKGGLLV